MKTPSLSSLIVPSLLSAAILPISASAKGGGAHSSSSKGSSSSDSSTKSGSGSGKSGSSSYGGSGTSIIIIHDASNPRVCYNQATMEQVPCPKQHPRAAVIAGIVIGSVFGALFLGVLIWYLYKKCLPKYRARKIDNGVSVSDRHYQVLEGHQSPEGVAHDDAFSISETSTFVAHEEGSQKKEWSMPDPEKGYSQPYERG